jgi:hypothetical protein
VHCGDVSPLVLPNRPAAHDVHEPWPSKLYVPGRHINAVALVDPATHACPAAQLPLHAGDDSPCSAPNRPAAHKMHDAAPASEYLPAAQTDAVALVDPSAQAYPAAQLPLHAADGSPGTAPYRPAAQDVHDDDPASEYLPAGHTDAVALVDPAAHAYPAAQLPLHAADDRPATAPYRPAAHAAVHAADVSPVPSPNRPAGHSTHSPAPDRLYRPTPHMVAVALVDPATHA